MGDPTCEKIKTFVSYLLVGMGIYTFCGFADVVAANSEAYSGKNG
jgi:hypothetical protein